ncbi:MAG TPA: response regulator [Chthoniobacterales bacterium]|nr:response regulator [Chthoniobacterales bacterium]
MRILVVEDDAADILFMRKAFEKVCPGITVDVAENGDLAVAAIERDPPTHVFLDLKLPKRSGLEILEWIRGRTVTSHLPVVILTSSNEKRDIERARELGVDDYRVKPVSFPELAELVRQILFSWGLVPIQK